VKLYGPAWGVDVSPVRGAGPAARAYARLLRAEAAATVELAMDGAAGAGLIELSM